MTALPSHMYGDPLNNILRDEAMTCKGCKHWAKYIVCGDPQMICEKNRKKRNTKCYEDTPGRIYCEGGK